MMGASCIRVFIVLFIIEHVRSLVTMPHNSHHAKEMKTGHVEKKHGINERHQKSLLQHTARHSGNVSTDILPEVSTVLQNSHRVLNEVGQQMAALQVQLADLQHKGMDAIQAQKKEYEARLETQRSEILATKGTNIRLSAGIEDARKKNKLLRLKASYLANASGSMMSEIEQMEENATLAIEYMQQTLNVSSKLLNSTEVQVLADLTEEDALMAKRLAREKIVQSVSMLQFESNPIMKPDDLMHDLSTSLDDAAKEAAASEAALKQEFEKRFQNGEEELTSLREVQTKLQATLDGEKTLQTKLETAVQHLEKVFAQLAQRRIAIRKYVQSVGLPEAPSLSRSSNASSTNTVS